jgi:energy-coupling factor transporter ATP-binding protein EcfA2
VMPRVEDEVAFGLEHRGWERPAMQARVREMLDVVGLAGFERRSTVTLSGGEQQRLAIADVLAPMPGLVVLDEPTANLDPPGMEGVFERLESLVRSRDRTVVIVEHRLEAALPLADLVLLLDDQGRQLAVGEPDEIGREHARTLEGLGSWVPRAWQAWATPGPVPAQPDASSPVPASAQPDVVAPRGGREPARPHPVLQAREPVRPHPVLRARELTVRYPATPGGSRDPAIDGVTLDLHAGDRVGLVGPNGSGKSSLLFVLAGIRRPDAGSVRLRGGALARLLGLVFQNPELGFVGRSCAAEIAAGFPALGRVPDPADSDVGAALERFGLAPLAAEDPFRISEGEQRRLGIAAVSIARPSILLLDEPTFGLDRRGADAVVDLLDVLRLDGQAQVMATHDPRLIPGCDRVIALDHGRVVFDGMPAAFLADPPYSPPGPWRDGADVAGSPRPLPGRPAGLSR